MRKSVKKGLPPNDQFFRLILENVRMAPGRYRIASLLANPATSELGNGNEA